ncbi:MAG: Stp1/IreP family PP2C-type Ser/Thr phosphatase [Oscillospiraceae bacterium]|nr:Stp1/IreP family PP2C-type Ser/Thr phosphatase [Oscillospiraceae bacterium]MBR6923776.1 Stp1/IreP family PP2C-type Ser/Thr phosphatase [Oscillospiraceae bacterium]
MKIASESDIGLCRNENQDMVVCEIIDESDGSCLIIVCDGMGGENHGKYASTVASEVVRSKFIAGYDRAFASKSLKNLLVSTVTVANSVIFNTSHAEPEKSGMGSTCVAAFIDAKTDTVHIVNVGDSRAYLCRGDSLEQITRDHSFVQLLMDQGKITEEETVNHPKKNMLIRAVGVDREIEVDYFETELQGARLLICTDGLHGCCTDEEIKKVLSGSDVETAAKKLVDMALEKGGPDNITLAVVENS